MYVKKRLHFSFSVSIESCCSAKNINFYLLIKQQVKTFKGTMRNNRELWHVTGYYK